MKRKLTVRLRCLLLFAWCLCALALTITPAVSSWDNGEENADVIKIGVVIYRSDDTFITNMMNSLKEYTETTEHRTGRHLNVNILDSLNSQMTQNDLVDWLISLDYDVLCVNLVDRTSAANIIDKAMDADTPVVFFNREPVQDDLQKWDRLYYVGTDAQMNGHLEGQIIVDAYRASPSSIDLNGDGILQYIILEGEIRHQDAILRTEGSIQVIRDAGIQVEKLDGGIASWERNQAAALTEGYFAKYGDAIEVVISNNDDMALGVLDTLERSGMSFNNIVGIDGTPQGIEAIKDGKMLGTVSIDYAAQAKLILDIAYALGTGEDPVQTVDIPEDKCVRAPCHAITRENIDEWD